MRPYCFASADIARVADNPGQGASYSTPIRKFEENVHLNREKTVAERVVLRVEREGALAILRIDDPQTRNALSADLTLQLVVAYDAINADMSFKCVILTATGEVFCAGGNIKEMYARANHFAGNAAEIRRHYLHGV